MEEKRRAADKESKEIEESGVCLVGESLRLAREREWWKDGALKRGVQNQKIEGSIVKQEPCQWMTKFLVRWSIQQGNQRMKVRGVLQQNRWCWVKLRFPRLMLTGKEEKKLNMQMRGKDKLLQWPYPRDHTVVWYLQYDGRLQAHWLLNLPVTEYKR